MVGFKYSCRIGLLTMFVLFCSCSILKMNCKKNIQVVEFSEFIANKKSFKGGVIGIKGYYVQGMHTLYIDKEYFLYLNTKPRPSDTSFFSYNKSIQLSKAYFSKSSELGYLDGSNVIVFGKPKYMEALVDGSDSPIYLVVDSIRLVLTK